MKDAHEQLARALVLLDNGQLEGIAIVTIERNAAGEVVTTSHCEEVNEALARLVVPMRLLERRIMRHVEWSESDPDEVKTMRLL